jgi:LysM repeat protein
VKVARVLLIVASILLPVLAAAQSPFPSVTITSPEPGLTIAADSVAIGATYAAPDESVVQQVELLIDGNVIEAYTVGPPQASGSVSFIWGALHFNDGAHTIAVRATDSEGRVGESEIRVLLGRNQLAPPVRVSRPLTGGAVSGTVSVDVDAGQRALIKYVIFLVDDVFKAMSNVSPFTYLWDTTRYLNGLHRLQVKVYFKAGAESLSPAVEVRVDNPGGATTLRAPEAGAGPAPEPIAAPARAAQSELPAPMRTESLSAPPLAIQVADPVVAIPGTAPYVSPAGDLVTPPAPSPIVAPAPPAAQPAPAAHEEPAPVVAPYPTAGVPVAPPTPSSAASPAMPAPADGPAEVASHLPAQPAPAPVQVALLPSPAPEAPVPPAQLVAAAPSSPSPALAEVAAVAVEPAPAGTHVAMLPERPEEQPVAAKPVPAPAPAENVYLVQPNDCLWAIASAHNTTVATLVALNDLPESGIIHPGQQLRLPSAQIYCDGKPLEADAVPIVANGRAIVPLRAVVESAGGTVTWQPTDRQAGASLNNHQVTVTIGSTVATLDGSAVTLAGPPTLSGNRTLVPLRFLGEAFDLVLEYQAGVIRIATVR